MLRHVVVVSAARAGRPAPVKNAGTLCAGEPTHGQGLETGSDLRKRASPPGPANFGLPEQNMLVAGPEKHGTISKLISIAAGRGRSWRQLQQYIRSPKPPGRSVTIARDISRRTGAKRH